MADDASSADAEERRAAVFGVIHPLFQTIERALREERARFARDALRQLVAQRSRHEFAERFRRFQYDIADESIADDDIGVAVVDVAAFGVADEVESRLFQNAERLLRQLVSFSFFFAD